MKKHHWSVVTFLALALAGTTWSCSSPADPGTDNSGDGGSSAGEGGKGGKASGGSGGKASGGSGGKSSDGGSPGTGGTPSTGGTPGTGGSGDGGSAAGGTPGTGGSGEGGMGEGGSGPGGSGAGGSGTGGSGAGGSGTGGGSGGPFTIKLLGMDETMAHGGGPVFTPAMSKPGQQSPAMMWSGVPAGAKSLALSMIDTQGPIAKTPPLKAGPNKKVHFVIFDIPPTATGLPAKLPNIAMLMDPMGALCTKGFEGRFCWFGPGGGPSVYLIQLWALDVDKLPGQANPPTQNGAYGALMAHSIGKPAEYLAAGTSGGF